MKKSFIGVLLAIVLLFSAAGPCSAEQIYANTLKKADPEQFYLVKEEVEDNTSYYHKEHYTSQFEYDEYGRETKYYHVYGDYRNTVITEYYENGNLKKISSSYDGDMKDVRYYDENGNHIASVTYKNGAFVLSFDNYTDEMMDAEIFANKLYKDKYDKNGILQTRTYKNRIRIGYFKYDYFDDGVVTEKYDKNGRLVKVTKEGGNGAGVETGEYTYYKSGIKKSYTYQYVCNGLLTQKSETYYNEDGDVIRVATSIKGLEDRDDTYTYTKDEKGRNIGIVITGGNYITTKELEYDSNGNVIFQKTVEQDVKRDKENLCEILKWKYDKENRLTYEYSYFTRSRGEAYVEDIKSYKFDKSGRLSDYKTSSEKKNSEDDIKFTSHEEKYKYYKSGLAKRVEIYNDGYFDESFDYNSLGYLTAHYSYNSKGVANKGEEMTYDSKNEMVKRVEFNGNIKWVYTRHKEYSDKKSPIAYLGSYDTSDEEKYENGKLVYSSKWTIKKNSDGTFTAVNKVNDNGNTYTGSVVVYNKHFDPIKETVYTASGSVKREDKYTLKYDSDGNLIYYSDNNGFKRWTYDRYGNITSVESGKDSKVLSKTKYTWERLKNIVK